MSVAVLPDVAPARIVGSKRWRQRVPKYLQKPLARALHAMEEHQTASAMQWFGECCELIAKTNASIEEQMRVMKPVLYFGGQVAAGAYFSLRGVGQDAPAQMLKEWRETAETLVKAAWEADPEDPIACHNVGRFLQDVGEDAEAITHYRKALALNPEQVESWGNLGTALYQQGNVDFAWECWNRCTQLVAPVASARLSQAYIWLRKGEYEQGWRAFNDRWKDLEFQRGYGRHKDFPGAKHWTGEKLKRGDSLLLHGEQGLGDHIQFARYVPLLLERGVEIAGLETRPILKRWMQAAFPDVAVYGRGDDELPKFSHHCPTMDLPGILGTRFDSVPGPLAPRDVEPRKVVTDGTKAIGLAWEGAKGNPADSQRSIPTELLRFLEDTPSVTWVSLQFSPDAAVMGRAWIGPNFVDGTVGCHDVLETASVMKGLDHIVCVDTLTAHLAGTLGCPTTVLHRFASEWRWTCELGERSPWYPSVRNWVVETPNGWEQLLLRVKRELSAP